MPVLYMTIDSLVQISPLNAAAKSFTGPIGEKQWVVADFKLGKKGLKIYHNEFIAGGHRVVKGEKLHYVVEGVVKMTIPPKSASQFLDGVTEWVVENIRVTDIDDNDPTLTLDFAPSSPEDAIKVTATLNKP